MDKFIVVKSINPGIKTDTSKTISPQPVATSTDNKENKDANKQITTNSSTKVNNTPSTVVATTTTNTPATPKKPPTTPKKKKDTTSKKEQKEKKEKEEDNKTSATVTSTVPATTASTTATTPSTDKPKETLHQTCVSSFFTPMSGDVPVWKYLFEKEAADRAERERLEAIRLEKEAEELRKKKEKERKRKMELKKIRDEEKQRREEEEWEEYQIIQEKRTKGVEIIPNLYLGSFVAAKNQDWLLDANVKKIVNCTSEVKCYFKQIDDVKDDSESEEEEDDDEDEDDQEDGQDEETKEEEKKEEVVESKEEKKEELKELEKLEIEEGTKMDCDTTPPVTTATTSDTKTTSTTPVYNVSVNGHMMVKEDDETILAQEKKQEERNQQLDNMEIEYFRIPIADSTKSPIEEYFTEACEFIDSTLKDQDEKDASGSPKLPSVLVHCKQGRSRSPTIILAYLISIKKWTLEKAWNHLVSVTDKLTVNDGFKMKLMKLDKSIHGIQSFDFYSNKTRSNTDRYTRSLENIQSRRRSAVTRQPTQKVEEEDEKVNVEEDEEEKEEEKSKQIKVDNQKDEKKTEKVEKQEKKEDVEEDENISTLDQLKIIKKRKVPLILDEDE